MTVLVAAPQRLLSGLGGLSTGFGAGVAPLAQTACGVGGVALVGACLGGPLVPARSIDHHAASAASGHQVVADAVPGPAATAKAGSPTHQGSRHAQTKRGAHLNGGGATAEPGDRRPPALRSPTPSSPSSGSGSDSGSGSSGASSGGTVDDVADATDVLPVSLPDPGEVVQAVTGQLPKVQTPVPGPLRRCPRG